jgi:hypothetical protein
LATRHLPFGEQGEKAFRRLCKTFFFLTLSLKSLFACSLVSVTYFKAPLSLLADVHHPEKMPKILGPGTPKSIKG